MSFHNCLMPINSFFLLKPLGYMRHILLQVILAGRLSSLMIHPVKVIGPPPRKSRELC